MAETLTKLISVIQQNPQRADLVVGFLGLCGTLQNPAEQSAALVACSKAVLSNQPLLALKILELSLVVSPRSEEALQMARDIFRRRGRWSAEQRVIEFMSTQTQVAATTLVPTEVSSSVVAIPERSTPQEQTTQLSLDDHDHDLFASETKSEAQLKPRVQGESVLKSLLQEDDSKVVGSQTAESRIVEFLNRCGFDQNLAAYASGVSQTNAGLVAFVSMLISLGLIRADDLMLAGIMLQKMLNERDDNSGANVLFDRLFPEISSNGRGGKSS